MKIIGSSPLQMAKPQHQHAHGTGQEASPVGTKGLGAGGAGLEPIQGPGSRLGLLHPQPVGAGCSHPCESSMLLTSLSSWLVGAGAGVAIKERVIN